MTYIRKADYAEDRVRPKLMASYLETMRDYLQLQYPQASLERIEEFVKATIRERFKSPTVEAIIHPSEGNSEVKRLRLDEFTVKVIADNNLSPSGTCYKPVSKKESFLRISIDDKVKARGAFKKLYLDYEAQGKKRESQYYYQNQANAKIYNNAIAGGMNVRQFILGCKAGFNAITSAGRMSVKQGYSFIERAVNANLYIPSVADAITYALNHARVVHPEFVPLIENNTLYCPTEQEVFTFLMSNVENYTTKLKADNLLTVIENMTAVQRAYVFYAGCLNNLCRYNETLMRTWVDNCFVTGDIDPALIAEIELDALKKLPDDVVAAVLSTSYKRLGQRVDGSGKWNTLKDAKKHNPQGLKEFIYCCQIFANNVETFKYVLQPIFQIRTTFAKMTFQHRMMRKTVPLSDTDSNIFSTQELVRWKRGKIDFSQEAYEMNAVTTFILSQSLEHVFSKLASGFGVEGEDVKLIAMKNEFLYPILIVTALGKHYLAIATMQEGSLLPNPRKDIKGVGFRSSTYPKLIVKGFEQFVVDLFAKIEEGEPILAGSILNHVANIEKTIYDSISERESDYLQTVSIKRREDYADPTSSQYFYYELWKSVFGPDYGEMVIPNKCYKIPLKTGNKLFRNPEFLEKMKAEHPDMHARLEAFLATNGKRDISAVLIPPFKGKIHPFFLEIMDIRTHISSVMAGYYHLLNALGIGTVSTDSSGLVSDFFDPSTALLE